jgi:cytochrome c oxidase assembly protein Cox11
MNTNGVNKYMVIFGFGALDDAISAAALFCQQVHCACFIEAILSAGEILRDFDVIVRVVDDIGLRGHEIAISGATGEQY